MYITACTPTEQLQHPPSQTNQAVGFVIYAHTLAHLRYACAASSPTGHHLPPKLLPFPSHQSLLFCIFQEKIQIIIWGLGFPQFSSLITVLFITVSLI